MKLEPRQRLKVMNRINNINRKKIPPLKRLPLEWKFVAWRLLQFSIHVFFFRGLNKFPYVCSSLYTEYKTNITLYFLTSSYLRTYILGFKDRRIKVPPLTSFTP